MKGSTYIADVLAEQADEVHSLDQTLLWRFKRPTQEGNLRLRRKKNAFFWKKTLGQNQSWDLLRTLD